MLAVREDELAAVVRLLHSEAEVTVVGPPGMGRTSVLGELTAQATRVWHFAAQPGDEQTAYLALAKVLSEVDMFGLPQPQADAIAAVLRHTAKRVDPLAVRLAALTLASAGSALLICIDDAQWLDEASATVFGYVRQCLPQTRLLLSRLLGGTAPISTGPHEVELAPLPLGHLTKLLESHGISCRDVPKLHAACGGNPRLALAIGSARWWPGDAGPVPDTVARLCRATVAVQPAEVRHVLLLTALAGRVSLPMLCRAGLSDASADATCAQHAGLLRSDGEGYLSIAAGAVAATVLADASLDDRRRGHESLGSAASDPVTRLWHQTAIVSTVDSQLAKDLGSAAAVARQQGQLQRAAQFGVRAADIAGWDVPRETLTGWLRDAAVDGGKAGQKELVRQIIVRMNDVGAPPVDLARARLAAVDAACLDLSDQDQMLYTVIAEAREAPELLSAAHLRLAIRACVSEASPHRAVIHARRSVQFAKMAQDTDAEAMALTFLAHTLRSIGDLAAEQTLAQALAISLPASPGIMDPRYVAARFASFDDRLEEARVMLLTLLPEAKATGSPVHEAGFVRFLAEVEARLGQLGSAQTHCTQAMEIASRASLSLGPVWHTAAVVQLGRGSLTEAKALADRAIHASEEEGDHTILVRAQHVRGQILLASGEIGPAVESLRQVRQSLAEQGFCDPSMIRWHGDLAEAMAAAGEPDGGLEIVWELRERAQSMGRLNVLALADRAEGVCRAALGQAAQATELLSQAAESFARLGLPLERGRTFTAIAAVERRRRRWAAARAAAGTAEQIYLQHGGTPWPSAPKAEPAAELSDVEGQIIGLVSSGATNREIAQQLFLSVKTVEATLTRLYRKLGIRSRTQLNRVPHKGFPSWPTEISRDSSVSGVRT